MSAVGICCGTTPSFDRIMPPSPPIRNLSPLRFDGVDLLAVEAAHLDAHIAAGDRQDAVLLHDVAHELEAAAGIHPGLLLDGVEPERHAGIECDGRVLADRKP